MLQSCRNPSRQAAALALGLLACLPAFLAEPVPGTFTWTEAPACAEPPCLRWTLAYASGDPQIARFHRAILSDDARTAYVLGAYQTRDTFVDLVTLAVDVATGTVLWTARYDGPAGSNEGQVHHYDSRSIALSPDQTRVVVAASSQGTFGMGLEIATVAYDAMNGTQVWVHRYNDPASRDDHAQGVAIDASSQYAITVGASVDTAGTASATVLGYALATGEHLWNRTLSNACSDERPFGVAAAGVGQVVMGGMASKCVGAETEAGDQYLMADYELAATAFNPATGATLWRTAQGDPLAPGASVYLHGTLSVAGGRVFVTGGLTSANFLDLDVFVLAVDTTGSLLWTKRHGTGGYDQAMGAVAAGDGSRLYVVAQVPGLATGALADDNLDALVLAVNGTSGQLDWQRRLDGGNGFQDHAEGTGAGSNGTAGLLPWGGDPLGTTQDYVPYVQPALFHASTRLAFSVNSQLEPVADRVGEWGDTVPQVVILDTQDGGTVASLETATQRIGAYLARPDRPDFLAMGYSGTQLYSHGVIQHYSLDVTPPSLVVPDASAHAATSTSGALVVYSVTAADDHEGPVDATCAPASGTLFPLGMTQVECEATDLSGNTGTASFGVQVAYQWSGFQGDVMDGAVLKSRYAEARFTLTGASAAVEDARATLWVSSATGGPEMPAIARGHPILGSADNSFRFESGDYRFEWDTHSLPPGHYQVRLDLGDGTHNVAQVRLR